MLNVLSFDSASRSAPNVTTETTVSDTHSFGLALIRLLVNQKNEVWILLLWFKMCLAVFSRLMDYQGDSWGRFTAYYKFPDIIWGFSCFAWSFDSGC